MMSTETSPKIRSTETCKNMLKIAQNIDNVHLDVRFETCVWVLECGAMWMPRWCHIGATFDGQRHMEMIFIRPLADVAGDLVPPKLGFATVEPDVASVAYYVACDWVMMWHAMSSKYAPV